MQSTFTTFQTGRLLYGTSDFHSARSLGQLYDHLEQVLYDFLGRSSFTLFFPSKLEQRLKPVHSTYFPEDEIARWTFELDNPQIKSLIDAYNETQILLMDTPQEFGPWPFPVEYCALLSEEQTLLGLLVVHEGLDETICEAFPVVEVLEPVIKHFTQALMRLKSMEEIEKSLDETNARLLAINEIGELLGHLHLDTLLSKIVSLSLQLIRAEVANLMILQSDHLRSRVEMGLNDEVVRGITWKDGATMVDWVLQNHRPILIENLSRDSRFEVDSSSHAIQSIVSIPLFTTSKDLGVLNVVNTRGGASFSSDNMATLQTAAGLASTAIENALLHREAIEREVFREQLRIARQIWENILPRSVPTFAGASISARSVPASVVGGDFYDFIPLGDDQLGLVIADVSGKGIPAAMIMNMAKTILHVEALRGDKPNRVLDTVNDLLVESTKMDSFVTLTYAVADRANRRILITNAGHNPCLLYRKATDSIEELTSENMPLAILPHQTFLTQEVQVEPGDLLFLYTDGVTEAMNRQGEMYEIQRLQRLLYDCGHLPSAESIVEKVFLQVNDFVGDAPQHDDTTVVVFKVTE